MKLILVARWRWNDSKKLCKNKAITLEPYHDLNLDENEAIAPTRYGEVVAELPDAQARALQLLRSRWKQIRKLRGSVTLGADGNPILDLTGDALIQYNAVMNGTGLAAAAPVQVVSKETCEKIAGPSRLLPD